MPDYPVAFLGAFESTVRDITAAYSIFPNHGILRPPYLIARVEDDAGHIIYQADHKEKRVVNPDSAWMVSDTMQQVMKTGTRPRLQVWGGRNPELARPARPMISSTHGLLVIPRPSPAASGWVWISPRRYVQGYGSALALPVWVDFMQNVPEKGYPAAPFEPPLALAKMRSARLLEGVQRANANTFSALTTRPCRVTEFPREPAVCIPNHHRPRQSTQRSRDTRRQPWPTFPDPFPEDPYRPPRRRLLIHLRPG
jgi:membrane peptidoglycan carboxypeptidase